MWVLQPPLPHNHWGNARARGKNIQSPTLKPRSVAQLRKGKTNICVGRCGRESRFDVLRIVKTWKHRGGSGCRLDQLWFTEGFESGAPIFDDFLHTRRSLNRRQQDPRPDPAAPAPCRKREATNGQEFYRKPGSPVPERGAVVGGLWDRSGDLSHLNLVRAASMSTSALPLRYSIVNSTASSTELRIPIS